MNNTSENTSDPSSENFNLKDEISYYLFFWPWFLLFTLISISGAFLYLRYTPNIYSSFAQVQITKSDASSSFLTTEVTSLFGSRVNVQNDISVITSNHILTKVVKRLNLQTRISEVGRVKSKLVFNREAPFEIQFKDSEKPQQWNLSLSSNSKLITNESLNFNLSGSKLEKNEYFTFNLLDTVFNKNRDFIITRISLNDAVASLKNRLKVTAPSTRGEIINFKISGTNRKQNDATLNELINVIIEDKITDQRKLSLTTIQFINDRIIKLSNTIDSISKETIKYQLKNDIYDTEVQTSNVLEKILKDQETLTSLKIQLNIATSLFEKLKSQESFETLPANIGIDDININQLITSFNTLVLKRNNLLLSATLNSPIILPITKQLDKLYEDILDGTNRYIDNIKVSLLSYQKEQNQSSNFVSGIPIKKYTLRTYAREFKFAEDLLVFLSQRKEEASISYVSVLPNLKVLSYGVADSSPLSPSVSGIYSISILLGLFTPFFIFFLLKFFRH